MPVMSAGPGETWFTGPSLTWAKALQKWHAEHKPSIDFPSTMGFVTVRVAVRAREEWESGWFTKGKIKELDALITLSDTVSEIKFHKPVVEVFDFLATKLGEGFWAKHEAQIL